MCGRGEGKGGPVLLVLCYQLVSLGHGDHASQGPQGLEQRTPRSSMKTTWKK